MIVSRPALCGYSQRPNSYPTRQPCLHCSVNPHPSTTQRPPSPPSKHQNSSWNVHRVTMVNNSSKSLCILPLHSESIPDNSLSSFRPLRWSNLHQTCLSSKFGLGNYIFLDSVTSSSKHPNLAGLKMGILSKKKTPLLPALLENAGSSISIYIEYNAYFGVGFSFRRDADDGGTL